MSNSFQLRIVTPGRMVLDERVREVTAPGSKGEIGVLPEHITFLGSLEIGVLTYRTEAGAKRLALRGGFAEFVGETMNVLADDAAFPQEVNVENARSEAASLEASLQAISSVDPKFAELDTAARWARARIDAATGRAS